MADYQLQASKFHKELKFTGSGILAPSTGHKLYGETALSIVVENVTQQNSIQIQGRLVGEKEQWQELAQVSGSGHFPFVNIGNYDVIRFVVLRYSPASGKTPKLISSGHFANADGFIKTENLLTINNEKLEELNCSIKIITKYMENINKYLSIITETNGDF